MSEGVELPETFDGLVEALGRFKATIGYDDDQKEHLASIERHLAELAAENDEYRTYAEQAIMEAQSLKNDYDELQQEHELVVAELNQLKMVDMVAKTEELTQAVYDYDRDMVESCVAEAAEYRQEVEELRARVQELEQDNDGLVQTLAEMRQNQQQLQDLQKSVAAGLLNTPGAKSEAAESFKTPDGTPQTLLSGETGAPDSEVGTSAANEASPTKKTPVQLSFNIVDQPAGQSSAVKADALSLPSGAAGEDPIAIADALSAVVGGAEVGVVATAARMLREFGTIDARLKKEVEEREKLQEEVDSLHETMTSKTFKAPSAWAEREVKYKQDKRRWEEAQKGFEVQITDLKQQVENLRSGSGASNLESRIQDLEEQVLQSQQERDSARAALHELQLSMRKEGEFTAGVITPRAAANVHDTVEKLESISHGSSASQSQTPAMTPDSVKQPAAVQAYTEEVERRLSQVENARKAIEAELAEIRAAANGDGPSFEEGFDLETMAIETEVSLLEQGVAPEVAHELAVLKLQLQQLSEQERQAAQEGGINLKFNIKENGDADEMDVDESIAEEKQEIIAQMKEMLAAENIDPAVVGLAASGVGAHDGGFGSPTGEAGEAQKAAPGGATDMSGADSFEAIKKHIEEADESAMTPEALQRLQELKDLLKAKEAAVKSMGNKGVTTNFALSGSSTLPKGAEGQQEQQPATSDNDVSFGSMATAEGHSPVKLNINLGGGDSGPDGRDDRIAQLESMLAEKKAEEENLRKELLNTPVRLSLNVGSPSVRPMTDSRASSGTSLAGLSMEALAKDRAEAEMAWAEHQKNTDGPGLLRANAQLEAKCGVLEGQLAAAKAALESAEADREEMAQQIEAAMSSGDMSGLAGWKERLRSSTKGTFAGLASPSKNKALKLFKRKDKSAPSKQEMAAALHGTQDALHEVEAERNALRRQLARMTGKEGKSPSSSSAAIRDEHHLLPEIIAEESAEDLGGRNGASTDFEIEVNSLREENASLMDQLVATKVRFAETHGDFLEARRALLRAREKQLQLQLQLQAAQAQLAQASSHLRPLAANAASLGGSEQSPSPTKSPGVAAYTGGEEQQQ